MRKKIVLGVCLLLAIAAGVINFVEAKTTVSGESSGYETKRRPVLTQKMFSSPNKTYIIMKNYDLEGRTVEVPEGSTLVFKGGSINNGTVTLNSNTVIKGNNAICEASYDGLSHKSLFVANEVENVKIYNLTIKGSYCGKNDGSVNPWSDKRYDAQNLLFIGNSRNVQIEGLKVTGFVNDNIGEKVNWEEKDRTNRGFAPVKIVNSVDVVIKNCSESKSSGEGWEFNFCERITIDNLKIDRKYGVSSLNVAGCHNFTMRNSTFITENSIGDLVNVLAQDALIENCNFKGGGFDVGNEFANRGYNRIKKESSKNVTITKCSFSREIRNESRITKDMRQKMIDNLKIVDNQFYLDASKNNLIIALYLGDSGNIGSVTFEGNTIEIKGSIKSGLDYFYQIIESYSQTYVVDSLLIRRNVIKDEAFTEENHYNSIVNRHLNGVVVASNVNSLIIENNEMVSCSGINAETKVCFPNMIHRDIIIKNNNMSFVCQKQILDVMEDGDKKQKVNNFEFSGNICNSQRSTGYMGGFSNVDSMVVENNTFRGNHGSFKVFEQSGNLKTLNNVGQPKIDGRFRRVVN